MRGLLLLLSFLWLSIASGQTVVKVTNEEGEPLENVSIISRDYSVQLSTDADGKVELPGELEITDVLYFVLIGYQDKDMRVSELEEINFIVILEGGLQLEEVLIVGRTNEESRDMVNQVHQIKTSDIELYNPQTSADALASTGQVFLQKSQMGGGSPVLRGFEANKVLLVVDGVRMNNAIYRNGHLQNAVTLDGSILENISVIFGPGSLMYGSDAIGGVMHFLTRTPKLQFGNKRHFNTQAFTRFSSANNEKSFHIDFDTGNSKLASLTSITYSDFGDLKTGENKPDAYREFGLRPEYIVRSSDSDIIKTNQDPSMQVGTGYEQLDLLQKFLYQFDKNRKVVMNFQYSTSTDVPRYDALTEYQNDLLRWAEWDYGPQKRLLASAAVFDSGENFMYNYLTSTISYQKINETRKTRGFMNDWREVQDEEVSILSATFDLEKSKGLWDLNYGVDLNINYVNSDAFAMNIVNNELTNTILTRYPSGDNSMSSIAGYLSATYKLNDSQRFQVGGRWTRTQLGFSYERSDNILWPEYFYNGIDSQNQAITWSAGWIANYGEKINIHAMISSSFRSPNLDDMAKIRRKADEITAPNPDLNPEKSISSDLTIGWAVTSGLRMKGTVFYTRLNEAIVRSPYRLPDGSEIIIDDGDTLMVVANINADIADVVGLSAGIDARLGKNLAMDATYNWTRGRINSDNNAPLSHIPPSFGKVALKYSSAKVTSSLDIRYNLKKDILEYGGSEDNPEYATPEGSLGWMTINLYNKFEINDAIAVDLGVENITDIHYRTFSSGVSAPGRNFVLTARIKI